MAGVIRVRIERQRARGIVLSKRNVCRTIAALHAGHARGVLLGQNTQRADVVAIDFKCLLAQCEGALCLGSARAVP
jgi:hypothetical protein